MSHAGKASDLGEGRGPIEYSYRCAYRARSKLELFGKLTCLPRPSDTNWETFPTCSSGLKQSPVDLKRPYFGSFLKLELLYKDYEWPVQQNDGHVLKVPFKDDGSALKIGDKEYRPVEAIFRSPSEHKLNGKAYDMEMQILHTDSVGNQVISIPLLLLCYIVLICLLVSDSIGCRDGGHGKSPTGVLYRKCVWSLLR